jgi:16S rRNA G966 N2-methylase RsmD
MPPGEGDGSRFDTGRQTMNTNDAFPWPVHPAAELFPLLGDDELRELADDIKVHGLREPIWLWNEVDHCLWLLDGRNRVRACQIAGIQPTTRFYSGDDPIGFSVSLNLKRRHLDEWDKAEVALGIEPLYAAAAARNVGGRPRNDAPKPPENFPEVTQQERESRERAAKVAGTTGRNVTTLKRIKRDAPDLLSKREESSSDKRISLGRAERIIRDREAEQRRIEQARAEAAAQPEPTIVDIRVGDFRDVLADLRDIDAIITDPPYPHEFIPLLEDLAAWADKVLTPDGVLAVLMGQTYLPEVYRLLDGHRPYRWTGCYLTDGPGYVSMARRVQSNWKPLIVYGGGPRFADIIRSEGQDAAAKSLHRWGQDYAAFHTIIERLTERGQTVADPFMGSGTTLLAAHALGRHAIGADVDPAAVATARERLS